MFASSSKQWADYSSEDENKKASDQSDFENEIEDLNQTEFFKNISPLEKEKQFCECLSFSTSLECLGFLYNLPTNIDFSSQNYRCNINNIVTAFKLLIVKNCEINDEIRLACVDIFYRTRHELFFKLVCYIYNFDFEKSDVSFKNFGIDSDRTPDLIFEENNTLIIIEISASSSFEKSAISKGLEEAGFESKYKKELDMLTDIDKKYVYIPILFDMSSQKNYEYLQMLSKLDKIKKPNVFYKSILKTLKEDLCIITLQLKKYLSAPSSILFSKIEPLKPNHNELSELYNLVEDKIVYRKSYNELCVSSPVYNKIINNWHRLDGIIENVKDQSKITVYLDTVTHRILIDKINGKFLKEDYLKAVRSNNKLEFFTMLYVKVNKVFKKSTDSSDGVKYILPSSNINKNDNVFTEIQGLFDHSATINSNIYKMPDLKVYEDKIRVYFNYNYDSPNYDADFEENFLSMISKNDEMFDNLNDQISDYIIDSDYDFISDKSLDQINIEAEFSTLIKTQLSLNIEDSSDCVMIQKNKNPFILPLAKINGDSYCDLKYKNDRLLFFLKNEISESDPYTCIIIDRVLEEDFEYIREKNVPSNNYLLKNSEKISLSREMTLLVKNYYKDNPGGMTVKISKTENVNYKEKYYHLRDEIKNISKDLKNMQISENLLNETQLIRLPTNNKGSFLGQKFLKETSHYKNKNMRSCLSGIGYRFGIDEDYISDRLVYESIVSWLSSYSGLNPVDIIDNEISDDCNLLKELKKVSMNEYIEIINEIKNSYLGHSASFISNLSHSLLYYSQMPFNSEYVRVDNLGYKDCLLIVRGGKKIFKSKSSKMFRIFYPIDECLIPWIETGKGIKSSSNIINIEDKNYILSPWMQLHESILNDSISFYTRVVSFTVLNVDINRSFITQFPKIAFNVLLAYHNRRQTEVMLANLRYILLATLGDFTGIMEIFKEFLGFNYDCFQSFIRSCILFNYPNYFNCLKEVKNKKDKIPNFKDYTKNNPVHLFSESYLEKEEDLALMIYSTFLMTKAPYQRPAERARNLKGILEIHDYFINSLNFDDNKLSVKKMYSKTTHFLRDFKTLGEYSNAVFNNDFNYDPSYCAQIGVFADSYFENRNLKEDIFTNWNSILNQCWDELATSTGLRGKFDDLQNFWGQKGYFIVYKNLANDIKFVEGLRALYNINTDDDKKRKLLRDLNIIYKVKVDEPQEFLVFHAVDKIQWRGGREIYVMDVDTKTVQQPIEKFMGYLCNKLDNELISIPSDKRAQVIHHSIFEKDLPMKETLTWYLTLDCSKWAPKSNFLKFIDLLMPMKSIPQTFKTHFLNYCQKLFHKRVYFNEAEVLVLHNNDKYKSIVDNYLKHDTERKGYYLEMPYSWVMGIFNYTSSFLHAVNQKYASYIIFKSSVISYNEETTLFMFAHSDDSGGRLTCKNLKLAKRGIKLYELQLKMCNHILSKKKSVISRFYFEILSVIYIFKKLLALLPKFLGGLRFTPSDKGPAQDMLSSYSKCIEVMVAGSCFNVAYIVMKMYSHMVYRFYNHNKKVSKSLYKFPVQYLGMPDSHPLMVLLCGSDSDIARLLFNGDKKFLITQHAAFSKVINTIDDEGPIKPIKFNISVRGLKKGFEPFIEEFSNEIKTWSVKNVNFHSTPFNFLSFLSKLNDPGFVGSLVNESTTRRFSRAYFMRKGKCINTSLGLITLSEMNDLINSLFLINEDNNLKNIFPDDILNSLSEELRLNSLDSRKQIEVLETTLNSPLRIMRYMDDLSLENKDIIVSSRTLKPTHIELARSPRTFSVNFDPAQLVSYIKEPDLSWALPNLKNMFTAKREVESLCFDFGFNIEEIDSSTLLKLCRNYSLKHKKEIYMYSQVPSEIRQIKTYSSFLSFLSTNTYVDKEIKGLILNLSGNLTDPGYLPVSIDEDVYMINSILGILKIFLKSSGCEFISKLNINPIKLLNWEGGNIEKMLFFFKKIGKDIEESIHFNLQLEYIHDILLMKFSSETNASFLKKSSFYYFPSNQKSRGGWYGSGSLVVYINDNVYEFSLFNNLAISMRTNRKGKINKKDMSFIIDVMSKSGLNFSNRGSNEKINQIRKKFFGIDHNGDYSIGNFIEINNGIPAEEGIIIRSPADQCELYTIKEKGSNSYILTPGENLGLKTYKIYTLPMLQGELMNLIKIMFNKNDFEKVMLEKGINDFDEFILTEIMTEFGYETYVNPKDFFDGYQSSEIFKVFQEVKDKSISFLPKKLIIDNFLPACEGSLLRILIDYTIKTGRDIIKTPENLSQELMEIRSQYPESVSAILWKNLVRCHERIYSGLEIEEIKSAYEGLYKYSNKNELESNIIKLLTHWGYGSLVNSIENYTLSKNDNNFWYFSIKNYSNLNKKITSNLFVNFHKVICKTMVNFSGIYHSLNYPYLKLYEKNSSVLKIINEMNCSISLNLYRKQVVMGNYNYNRICFNNCFLAYMEDEDFILDLRRNSSKDYILCGIDFSYNNRKKILALYNTLLLCYCRDNSENCKLNFLSKVERLSLNTINPISNYNKLCIEEIIDHVPKFNVKYHNFLNDDILSYMKSAVSLNSNNIEFRISQDVVLPSKVEVPCCDVLDLNHVYSDSVFDEDNWEEIISTISIGDSEKEEIDELLDEIKNKFKRSKTRKLKTKQKVIQTVITWVIDPYIQNVPSAANFYRQCGENIIVLTTEFIKSFSFFPNSHLRLINFNQRLKIKNSKDILAYVSSNKLLDNSFWDKFLGGKIINPINNDIIEKLYLNSYILGKNKIDHFNKAGKTFQEIFNEDLTIKKDDELDEVKNVSKKEEQEANYLEKISSLIKKANSDGYISDRLKWRLLDKYTSESLMKIYSLEELFKNCMNEVNLSEFNVDLTKNKINSLTREDYVKTFQAPQHFNMAHTFVKSTGRTIRDQKINAEINSVHSSLSKLLASDSLGISEEMYSIVKANYKMWLLVIKSANYKKENKKFIVLFLTTILNSTKRYKASNQDPMWQDIINLYAKYMSDDGPDSDDKDSDDLDIDLEISSFSRLKYRAIQF